MTKLILFSIFIVSLNLTVFTQQEKYTAPINWERFAVSEKQISILLPKMPVFYESSNVCEETESNYYAVYAEEIVYQLRIVSKSKRKIPKTCDVKSEFGKNTFERRLKELKMLSIVGSETKFTQGKKEVIEFKEKSATHWIFDDLKNDKWIELSMTFRENIKPDFERYRKSLEFVKNPNGKEIGAGAAQIFGDESLSKENDGETDSSKGEGILIVTKFSARYTDAAKDNNVQGSVNLRVVFLANGGIGSVIPASSLPYGLTEQAIAAAKKITFLPARKNGKKVSITKLVQYTFTIY